MTTITDSSPIIEKIRAGRRAALSSLHTRLDRGHKIVSIFENAFPQRQAVPEFHSVRGRPTQIRVVADAPRPSPLRTNPIAA